MRNLLHSTEIAERWFSYSLAQQMGNIGSEVSRTLKWRSRNPEIAEGALYRALELIDLTLDDPRHRASAPRLREFCRVREVLLDFMVGTNEFGSTEASLQRYFDVFAVAASRRRAET
jgi:hypothetical protein